MNGERGRSHISSYFVGVCIGSRKEVSCLAMAEGRLHAWQRLASDLPKEQLAAATTLIGLADVPTAGADILAGKVKGRLVVDVNA